MQGFSALIYLAISGKWTDVREGGKEETGALRRSTHGVPLDWIVVLCLPWWQAKAQLALEA